MKLRKLLIGTAAAVLGLPLFVVMVVAGWVNLLDRTNGTIVSYGEERESLLTMLASRRTLGFSRS